MTLTRLDRQYGAAVSRVWTSVRGRVGRSWTDLGSWRDADVKRFQRAALPTVLGGQRQVASLTVSYLETLYRETNAEDAHPIDLDFDAVTGTALRGVDPAEVYFRPFKDMRRALSNGESLDVAIERGAHRLDTITSTDLQLARTHTVREVAAEQGGVTYTVRELFGEYDCALCMIASTQRYHKKDLQPIHPGCDCIVKTVSADYDPGQVIDEETLERVHALVEEATGQSDRGGRAIDYRQIIIAREHGEIGPVLGFRDQKFTGPEDVGSPTHSSGSSTPPPPSTPGTNAETPEDEPGPLGSSIVDGTGDSAPSAELRRVLDHAIAAIARVHGADKVHPPFRLAEGGSDGPLGRYEMDHTTRKPMTLTLRADGSWPELTAVHELGHFLDHAILGQMHMLSGHALDPDNPHPNHPLREWFAAIKQTEPYRLLEEMRDDPTSFMSVFEIKGKTHEFYPHKVDYFISPVEMFARSYAQWIAIRSNDPVLLEQLRKSMKQVGDDVKLISGPGKPYPRQWELHDFADVADAFDDIFDRLGLLK